jgi:hypothetical protein
MPKPVWAHPLLLPLLPTPPVRWCGLEVSMLQLRNPENTDKVDKEVRKKMVRKLWWFTFIMLSLGSFLIMVRAAMMAL